MMRLHGYNVTFQYVQGSQLFNKDTLSRAYLPDPGFDVHVMAMNSLLDIPDMTRREVREETGKDPALQTLLQVTDKGWPAKKE